MAFILNQARALHKEWAFFVVVVKIVRKLLKGNPSRTTTSVKEKSCIFEL